MKTEIIVATSRQMKKTRFIIKHMGAKMGTNNMKINYPRMRKIAEKAQMLMKVLPDVTFEQMMINGIETEMATPYQLTGDDIIFYIHGGGMVVGNVKTSRAFASYLAVESGLRVYTITYRLAPENPFPAGFDDCFSAYKGISDKHSSSAISLIGESGGGCLVLGVALRCLDENIKPPTALCAYSPGTDLTGILESHTKNAKTDIQIGGDIEAEAKNFYIRDYDASNPYISPLQAKSLKYFPPTFLVADVDEVLYDDSVEFAKRLEKDNVEYELYSYKNTFHAFPIAGVKTPESQDVLRNTVVFINKYSLKH